MVFKPQACSNASWTKSRCYGKSIVVHRPYVHLGSPWRVSTTAFIDHCGRPRHRADVRTTQFFQFQDAILQPQMEKNNENHNIIVCILTNIYISHIGMYVYSHANIIYIMSQSWVMSYHLMNEHKWQYMTYHISWSKCLYRTVFCSLSGTWYTCLCSNVFHVVIYHVAEYASSFIRRPKIWLFLVLEHRKTGRPLRACREIHATSHLALPPTNILSV